MADAVSLFERATAHAAVVLSGVRPEQLALATPCSEWDVQALVDHLAGGHEYLLDALGEPLGSAPHDAGSYADLRDRCLAALARPGAGEVRCVSPLGFEWSVAEATAGTFMDQLVHTWDLATCVAMFLPEMPERGRAAGLIGPAVAVPADASPQDRLLGAMGRRP
jgi:uncharacterized protein (TIGR03086 family)